MKKKISLLLAILMLVTLIPTAFAESKTVDAVKNTKKITLDGEEVMVGAYDVEGYNYLKLRDVAAILNTKKCQFNVGFDKPTKLITVELAKGYEKVEGDLAEIKDEKAKAIIRVIKILVNGEEKEVKTALINENNYMQLRDLGSLVGLGVGYDKVNKVIMLKSDVEAKEEEKPEEKPEEVKTEEKYEQIPEDKWTDAEKEWFEGQENMLKFGTTLVFSKDTYENDPIIKYIKDMYYTEFMRSRFGGRILFYQDVERTEKKVEIRDGARYAVVTFYYPSGAYVKYEGSKIGTDDVKTNSSCHNQTILTMAKDISDDYKKDLKLIGDKLIEFHDAIVAKDYEKAVKAAHDLNVNADVESVKLFEARMKEYSGDSDIFKKDYTTEFYQEEDEYNAYVTFKYTDGDAFKIMYMHTANTGIVGYGYKAD